MTCRSVHAMCDSYIDGELDSARASAVRGHARDCAACRTLLADTARLREELAEFEPIEPPPGLWNAIGTALANAERADAKRSWLSLWGERVRPKALPAAVGLAAAFALVVWWTAPFGVQNQPPPIFAAAGDGGEKIGAAESEPSLLGAVAAQPTLQESHAASLADADAVHLEVVRELEAIYESERDQISPTVQKKVDQALAALSRGDGDADALVSLGGGRSPSPAFAGEGERQTLRKRAAILQAALVERPGQFARVSP